MTRAAVHQLRSRASLGFFLAVTLVVVVALTSSSRFSDAQDTREQVGDIMKAKLRHSQALLKGIALEDYESIIKDSQALSLLSQEASWNVIQTEDYLTHSIDFRRAADSMNKAAKEKNLDAVTLAYFQMTLRCVDCHRHVRSVRIGAPALDE